MIKKIKKACKKTLEAVKKNKLALFILVLQLVTLYRVELISDKIDRMVVAVAGGMMMMLMNIAAMFQELARLLLPTS